MKKILLFIYALLIVAATIAQTPVAYYPFNGNANDAAGSNNGTVNGANLTIDRFGNANSAYNFDGVDDNISINNSAAFNFPNSLTISLWVKYNGAGTAGKSIWSLISKNFNGNGNEDQFHIWVNATDKSTGGRFGTGPDLVGFGGLPAIDNGLWHQIQVVFDNPNNVINHYLDGVLISTAANTANVFNNGSAIKIGYWEAFNNFFNGVIDEVKIYNTALTAVQVQAEYESTVVQNYRSKQTGNWSLASTWEIFNGTAFIDATVAPSSLDGVITIRNGHNVSIFSAVTTDQTIIETGGTLTQNSNITLNNGIGDDMTVNGNWVWNQGNLEGSGNVLITAPGNFTMATGNNKNVGPFNVTNNGIIDWQDGLIQFGNGGSTLTNNGQFTITGNNSMVGNTLTFINTGTITKTSSGVTSFSAVGTLTNSGTINFNAGILQMNMATTNTGVWSFAGGTVNKTSNLNWNSGASIIGTGTFTNNAGTTTLNDNLTLPTTVAFSNAGTINGSGDLIINNDFTNSGQIEGSGTLVVTGNFNWTQGSFGRSYTVPSGKTFSLTTGGQKNMGPFNITNNGTIEWQDGLISLGNGASTLTNNGQFTITGNNSMVGNTLTFINTGTITKTSSGVTSFSAVGTLTNSGTMNFNAGIVNLNMTTTNTGVWSFAGGTVNNNSNLSWNSGASITGSGAFNISGGTTNLNADISIPPGIAFSVSNTSTIITGSGNLTINNDFTNGGQIEGAGVLVVTGNMNWTQGSLSRSYTIPSGKTLSLTTGNQKNSNGFNITNNGTIDWQDGFINLGTSASTLTNNAQFNINGNNSLNSGVPFTFLNNGTVSKTSTGSTTFSGGNVTFNNNGTLKGIGTFNFNITGFVNNGIIAPGTSPGIFTVNNINGIQPLSANSNLQIEMLNGSGVGTGHDQLVVNSNLTLAGTLTVTELAIMPNGTYTIINLTSGTISGSFSTTSLPAGYSLQVNATSVQLVRTGSTLPLSLISFAGNKRNNDALLQWKTANETGVNKFEVQRSIDGQTFTSIGTVAPGGSLYSFTDVNTFSNKTLVYYRLKSVDTDGRFTLSHILKLSKQLTNQPITVFPNPVKNAVTISGIPINTSFKLLNAQGQMLKQFTTAGQSMVINMSDYSSGMYLLQYLQNEQLQTIKLLKQ